MISRPLKLSVILFLMCSFFNTISAYFDMDTTTVAFIRTDTTPRQSFFRWQWTYSLNMAFWHWDYDWDEINRRRRLVLVAGISIDFLPLGTGTILNLRTILTSDNIVDAHMHRQRDLRIWALGRGGLHVTPFRYRVWRCSRVFPRSLNPEHWHGPRGIHQPRHDVTVIHTLDQMYIYTRFDWRFLYPYQALLTGKHEKLWDDLWMAGSGYEYMEHIYENYKIFYTNLSLTNVIDCSKYLPKWWGKFICMKNVHNFPGVPSGGGLFKGLTIVGIGCFEIRYNEDRVMVFTDLRYYRTIIEQRAWITSGQYYEYAYPQWGLSNTFGYSIYQGHSNYPNIPVWQKSDKLWPLGKRKK